MSWSDRRSAEHEVNTFWNGLVAGADMRASSLDASLADLIVSIHRSDDAPGPDPVFVERLLARLPAPDVQTIPGSASVNLALAARPHASSERGPRARLHWSRAWTSLALLLVVTLGITVSFVALRDGNNEPEAIPAAVWVDQSPVPGLPQATPLAQFHVDPEEIAPGGQSSWSALGFQLIELEPGDSYHWYKCSGCTALVLVVVQRGEIRLELDGPVLLSGQQGGAVQQSAVGDKHMLASGDAALFDPEHLPGPDALRNTGNSTAQFLVAISYPELDYQAGLDMKAIVWTGAWGVSHAFTDDIHFEVERIVVPPGSEMTYESSPDAIDLRLLVAGELEAQSAGGEPFPPSIAHWWSAPAGIQTERFPDGNYALVNSGTGDALIYQLTITYRTAADATEGGLSSSSCAQLGC